MKHNIDSLINNDIEMAILDAYNIEDDEMNIVKATVVNGKVELEIETIKSNNDTDEITINNIDNLKNIILNAVKITEGIIMEIPKQYAGIDEGMFIDMYNVDTEKWEDYTEELKEFTEDTELWETQRFINDNKEEIKNTIQQYIAIQNNKAEAVCEG